MRPMNPTRSRGATMVAAVLTTSAAAGTAVAFAQAPGLPGTAGGGAAAAPATAPAAEMQRSRISVRSARRNVNLGARTLVKGRVTPRAAGRRVRLQVRRGDAWRTVARDVTGADGAYRVRYTPGDPASLKTRVVVVRDARHRAARRNVGRVNVYREALASWYGPGLYGGHLACGGRLTPGTLGVAHKSLPCGTKVTLRHAGRSVRVAVVDRGPYVGAREFDLTSATRSRIGFSGQGIVLSTR